jgi:RNA polymerase sigma-70 factor, ECF subfamily
MTLAIGMLTTARKELTLNSFATDAKLLVLPISASPARKSECNSDSLQPDVALQSDEALLSKVRGGDEDALGSLFRRYGGTVHALGRRILRDKTEADDLVQEVFFYIHRKSVLFDTSKGSARSWIIQVAYTQALIRRRQLKYHGFYASPITDKSFDNSSCGTTGAQYDNTAEGFFGKNGWRNVWDSLTECQRETLRLHFYEGCTFTEIAEKLGQSYVNIRHHYYRGLEKLRKHADENDLNWP